MYKHILLPTDGSPLSKSATSEGIQLAKALGARVTGLNVVPQFGSADAHRDYVRAYGDGWRMPGTSASPQPPGPAASADEHLERARGMAEHFLAEIESAAKDAGVTYDCTYRIHDEPYEAIIEIAKERNCDLIAMASHGWRGIKALVLGSETQKVLTHSTIPVLVFRAQHPH